MPTQEQEIEQLIEKIKSQLQEPDNEKVVTTLAMVCLWWRAKVQKGV